MFYTLKQISSELIEARAVEGSHLIAYKPEDSKFTKVQEYLNAGKLLSISERGTVSGRKDYEGYYKAATKSTKAAKPMKVKLTKLDDLSFSDDLFTPMQTGTVVDKFLSNDGGFMPGSNIMAAGAPGVGKTTVLLELLYKVQQQNEGKKVLFISAEMNQLDMARYLKRFPHWGQLPILFLSDYVDQDPQQVIESVLNEGYDLVLTDSYTEVNDTVKEECNLTRSKTEKWFLDLMIAQNQGKNKRKVYTTFVTILQLSKGGTFVGSNKLKHMTTAMMDLNWKGGENSSERYMEFTKNRLGAVGQKLFFDFSGGVSFNEGRYTRDLLNQELIAEEKAKLETESDAFDKLFGALPDEGELNEAPAEVFGGAESAAG
jgi:predicted ATP-dependent serine protease